MTRFHAFDLHNGIPVKNIIYASLYKESEIESAKVSLQKLCDEYKHINFKAQLRRDSDQKVMWESAENRGR